MARFFSIFPINRTIGNITFYQMEGQVFARKKSSLTRRKVLYAPRFANTRHHAGLMAIASKIGSFVYNGLPQHWRQGWMYRAFTGEALTLLKTGSTEQEIKQLLWELYVKEVADKQRDPKAVPTLNIPVKRAYHKRDTDYWERKTIKGQKRRAHKQRIERNAGLLSQASRIASRLYQQLPLQERSRSSYQQLTGMVMRSLKENKAEQQHVEVVQVPMPVANPRKIVENKAIAPANNQLTGHMQAKSRSIYFVHPLYRRFRLLPATLPPVKACTVRILHSDRKKGRASPPLSATHYVIHPIPGRWVYR